MSTNTTNMAMGKAVDGDNAKTYLETTLGAALDKIDAHDHSGTTHGIAISPAGLAFTGANPIINGGTVSLYFQNNANTVANMHIPDAGGLVLDRGNLTLTASVSAIVGGATSFNITNAAITQNNLTITNAGLVTMPFLGAFAASDKYVVIDASGNLHKSAIGPAS